MVKGDKFGTYLRLLVALFKVDDFTDIPMICHAHVWRLTRSCKAVKLTAQSLKTISMFGHEVKQTAFKTLTMVSRFQEFRFLRRRTEMRATETARGEQFVHIFFLSLTSRHTLTF